MDSMTKYHLKRSLIHQILARKEHIIKI